MTTTTNRTLLKAIWAIRPFRYAIYLLFIVGGIKIGLDRLDAILGRAKYLEYGALVFTHEIRKEQGIPVFKGQPALCDRYAGSSSPCLPFAIEKNVLKDRWAVETLARIAKHPCLHRLKGTRKNDFVSNCSRPEDEPNVVIAILGAVGPRAQQLGETPLCVWDASHSLPPADCL